MQIKPKPMKLVTEIVDDKSINIPKITPKEPKQDSSRYFRPPFQTERPVPFERRVIVATVGALLVLWILQGIVMALNGFFGTYDVKVHPLFNWPFTIERRQPKPSSQKPSSEVVKPEVKGVAVETKPVAPQATPQPDRIAYFIWSKESGKGTAPVGWHINCRLKGLWNEIGYGGPDFCFTNKDEGFARLKGELVARIAKQGLKETLCVYNKGFNRDGAGNRIPFDDCSYYQDYLKTL